MKKSLVALPLLALVVAACGGGSSVVAATVGDVDITVGEVEDLIEPEGSTITKEEFAQFLGFGIQWEIIRQAANAGWGIELTDEEINEEADRIIESAMTPEDTREEFLASRGVTEGFLFGIAQQGLIDQAVRDEISSEVAEPSQEEIDAEMDSARASLTEVCVSHILVPTQADAEEVVGRIDAGEDFGTVAAEVSEDPGSAANEGALPCGSAGQYVAEFRDASLIAPIGEIHDELVQTQFGFHVMLVTGRTEPTDETLPTEVEIVDGLVTQAVGNEINNWFIAVVTDADVTVDEEYGTWQTTPQPAVIPPA